MGARVTESITQVVTATGWTVRVWWKRAAFEDCFEHTVVTETVRDNAASPETIRAALEALEGAEENLAAFQIADRFGNGAVIYPNWPD